MKLQGLPVDRSMRLPLDQYHGSHHKKTRIVLHFTAGQTACSAFNTWMADPLCVGAQYIVDSDPEATIYETMPPECWIFSLGIHDGRGPGIEQSSIAIEIANVGPLKRCGENLCWWPKNFGKV